MDRMAKEQRSKALANWYLTREKKNVGVLVESALKDITRHNTFFNEKQFSILLDYSFENVMKDEKRLKDSGLSMEVKKIVVDRVVKTTLEDDDICPSVTDENGKKLYTTPDLLEAEKDIRDVSKRMSSNGSEWLSPEETEETVKWFVKQRQEQGYEGEKPIRDGIRDMLKPGNLKIVNGPPGSGKTVVCEGIAIGFGMCRPDNQPDIYVTAPTGKAAAAALDDTRNAARFVRDKTGNRMTVNGGNLKKLINRMDRGELNKGSILMIDEAGLLGSRDMANLLKATEKAQVKLVLIGDNKQIPPDMAGDSFSYMVDNLGKEQGLNLTNFYTVFRQKNADEAKASEQIRAGDADKALDFYSDRKYPDGSKALNFVETPEEAFDKIAKDYVGYIEDSIKRIADGLEKKSKPSAIILTPDRETAEKMNETVRNALKEKGILTSPKVFNTAKGQKEIAIGDDLIFKEKLLVKDKKSNTGRTIIPGMTGTVTGFSDDNVKIMMENNREVYITPKQVSTLKHSRALSMYSAQGASRTRAFLCVQNKKDLDLSNGLVAFTRHTHQMTAYVPKTAYKDVKEMAASMSSRIRKPTVAEYEGKNGNKGLLDKKYNEDVAKAVARKLRKTR